MINYEFQPAQREQGTEQWYPIHTNRDVPIYYTERQAARVVKLYKENQQRHYEFAVARGEASAFRIYEFTVLRRKPAEWEEFRKIEAL